MKAKVLILGLICFFVLSCDKTPTTQSSIIPETSSKPDIVSFSASPEVVKRGSMTILSWEVKDSTSVEIDNDIGCGFLYRFTFRITDNL